MRCENNQAEVSGKILNIESSHVIKTNVFSKLSLEIKRLSERTDIIQVIVKNLDKKYTVGQMVYIFGSYRSRNIDHHKSLYLYADYMDEAFGDCNFNDIVLHGYICKNNGYRKTPKGREITDAIMSIKRPNGIRDYIPCVFWGINAGFAHVTQNGDRVTIHGRIQSREYRKLVDGKYITKVAYEVSVRDFDAALPAR